MLATRAVMGAAGNAGLSEDLLRWLVNVDVFMTASSHTNWDSISTSSFDDIYSGRKFSSGTQNDEINFDISLAAGTWTFELIYLKGTSRGICSVQIDGVEQGTIDMYNSSTTYNNRAQITGISIATSGKVTLKLKMTSKNASSSSYGGTINHLQLKRTA